MSSPPFEILNLPPAELLVWVRRQFHGELPWATDFNWHGLAETAAMNARDKDASPHWAEIAIGVYAWLAQRSKARMATGFTLSEMHVRARQISNHGVYAGHPVRDPQVLLAWFHGNCSLSYADASAKAANWRSLPASDIAKLRRIKNQLGAIAVVFDQLDPADGRELLHWLELRPHLP